jgi:hypothetical protein
MDGLMDLIDLVLGLLDGFSANAVAGHDATYGLSPCFGRVLAA